MMPFDTTFRSPSSPNPSAGCLEAIIHSPAAPVLTDSGFTALLAGERHLWRAMDRVIRERNSVRRTILPAMLKLQHPKIEIIIGVVSQQFERLQIPGFEASVGCRNEVDIQPSSAPSPIVIATGQSLVAMHGVLITLLESLTVQKRGGLRGRIIIREISRWHVGMVTELLGLPVGKHMV